jgi:hypothetical protein
MRLAMGLGADIQDRGGARATSFEMERVKDAPLMTSRRLLLSCVSWNRSQGCLNQMCVL